MLENVNPSICMDILSAAMSNRSVCVRQISSRHSMQPEDALDVLTDMSLSGVIVCRPTPLPGFLSLALGPKSLQAIFLFALNCDDCGNPPPAVSTPGDHLAIVGDGRAC